MRGTVVHARPESGRRLDFSDTALSGVSVETVNTETAALDVLRSAAVDCVVLEQDLDAGTGLGVLRSIRPERPSVPILLCTDDPDGRLASEATRHDVSAYHVHAADDPVEARVASLVGDEEGMARPVLRSDGAAATHGTAFSSIADTINDAVVTIDADSTIHFANDALAELTGYDHETLVGSSFTRLMPERFREAHQTAVDRYAQTRERTLDWDYIELAIEPKGGEEIPVAVSFSAFERDGELLFTGLLRDIRTQKTQERSLSQLHEVASDTELSTMEKVRRVIDDHRERLGLSIGFLSRIEDEEERLVAAVGDHELAQDGLTMPVEQTFCQHTIERSGPVVVTDPSEATALDASVYEQTGFSCYVGQTVRVDGEVYGTLCFADEAAADHEFDDADVAFLEVLADWVGYELTQNQQREQLREERRRIQTILDRVDDAFFAVDEDWQFTYFNRRAEEVLGKSREEVIGENIWQEFPDAVGSTFDEQYHRAMETQEVVTFEEHYPPLETWFEVSAYPSEDGLSVYFSDVTDRREYTESLSQLLTETQQLALDRTAADVAQTVLDAAAAVFGCDVAAIRRLDPVDGVLRPVETTAEATDVAGVRPDFDADCWGPGEAVGGTEAIVYEDPEAEATRHETGPRPDALSELTEAMFVPLGNDAVLSLGTPEPEGFSETAQSLAELLASHAALAFERVEREQDLRTYETVLESLQGMVYATDGDGTVTLATGPLAEWLGYDRERLVGADASLVLDDDSIRHYRESLRRLTESDRESVTIETELLAADGTRLPTEIEVTKPPAESPLDGSIGVVNDLTALREARQQLATERDRFSYLFDAIPDAVIEVTFEDGDPVVDSTNEAFEEMFGYTAETAVGTRVADLVHPTTADPGETGLYDPLRDDEQSRGEVQRVTADGLRYFLFRGIPYEGPDGHNRGFGIYTDITERRQSENRLRVLTRVLRHNLRNDLAVLLSYAELLAEGVEDDHLADIAASMCAAVDDVSRLSEKARAIQQTLDKAGAAATLQPVRSAVDDAIEPLQSAYPAATVETDVPASLSAAIDDRVTLAVENLLENALEHAGEAPHVRISATRDGDTLSVTVADDGPGIPDQEWDVVTGRTKITQLSHGSGLGLWAAKWVAESYGGHLRRRESDLAGAAVELRLPGVFDT